MAPEHRWTRQWERVRRWYRRIVDYGEIRSQGDVLTIGQDEFELLDFLEAALVATYHLKDHVKNDKSLQHSQGSSIEGIEGFIGRSDALALCADLANGYKHLSLSTPRSKQAADIVPVLRVHLDSSVGARSITLGLSIVAGSRSIDPVKFLEQCILDWEHFLVDEARILIPDWRSHYSESVTLPPKRGEVVAAPENNL